MNDEIAIRVDNLSKSFRIPHENRDTLRERLFSLTRKLSYETFTALDNVSFEIRKGEFFGIIGRNGSGKSTLLKILAGIYTPDSGNVTVNDEISPFLELGVGFNPELSGRDNIFLNGTILGLTRKEIRRKFDEIVAFSELERFIDQKLKNYSSGMQVRLAFSVAIHANKGILLMDEVLAVGDTNFQAKCISEFLEYRRKQKTVIFVTHDIATAQKYCDRLMLLRDGAVALIGNSNDVALEYLNQNLTDEEWRILKESPVNNERSGTTAGESGGNDSPFKWTNKKAKLGRVEFLNDRMEVQNVFKTGDDLIVRVYFSKRDDVANLNFGIAIYSQENYYIFGINTFLDKIDTRDFVKNGFCEVRYPNLNLGTNKYYIKSGLWEDQAEKLIDFMDHSQESFRIQAVNLNEGVVHLEYHWGK